MIVQRAYFRPDNTEGYDAADLAALNLAWAQITSHGAYALDDDDVMLDNWAETLLAEYDAGKRAGDLTDWFYR
jgi:hypothetical protein